MRKYFMMRYVQISISSTDKNSDVQLKDYSVHCTYDVFSCVLCFRLKVIIYTVSSTDISTYSPTSIGTNSLYVTCWYIPISNLLASWYSRSSFHKGLILLSSSHNMLCNLNNEIVWTAMSGCMFTLESPWLYQIVHM